jgi:adenine-specific DNA-methyltransferase
MAKFDAVISGELPWQIERGDATRLVRELPDASVDSWITDPPWGIELSLQWTRVKKAIRGDGRVRARRLWQAFIPEAYRAAKPDTAHLFFAAWNRPWAHDLLAEHFHVKQAVVWFKRQWGLGWYLRPRFELAYYCQKGRPPLPEKADGNVWEHARDRYLQHPCQKPVELLRRAVRLCCPPGGVVGDLFCGAGAAAVAAVMEGRRFVGGELEAKYCRLARGRVVAAT